MLPKIFRPVTRNTLILLFGLSTGSDLLVIISLARGQSLKVDKIRHVKFLKKNAGQGAEWLVFYLKFCARAICQNMYKARLESFQDNV